EQRYFNSAHLKLRHAREQPEHVVEHGPGGLRGGERLRPTRDIHFLHQHGLSLSVHWRVEPRDDRVHYLLRGRRLVSIVNLLPKVGHNKTLALAKEIIADAHAFHHRGGGNPMRAPSPTAYIGWIQKLQTLL